MKKIITALLLAVMLLNTMLVSTAAEARDLSLEEELAADLKELGLFKGVSETDFALDRAPDRTEALVMLIRLLGKEEEALGGNRSHPFTDVPAWADKYVGYAYDNELTNGVSATLFGSSEAASSSMYLTFVLRALGYSDNGGADFTWDDPYDLALRTNILPSQTETDNFLRADVVSISHAALSAQLKNSRQTLAEKLIDAQVFTREKYLSVSSDDASPSSDALLTNKEIIKACSPAVFDIIAYDLSGTYNDANSGFFISSDGLAITNYHNVSTALHLYVCTSNNKFYFDVSVIAADSWNDLALLKINGSDFPYLSLADSDRVEKDQEACFLKDPSHLSEGVVSDPKVNVDGTDYFRISMPLRKGTSGTPLLDRTGKVIGVVSDAFMAGGESQNMAIPSNYIKALDKTAQEPLTLWLPYYYPGFENVYDFGRFTGVDLLAGVAYEEGAYLEYDAYDFYDDFEMMDSRAAYSPEECRNIAINTYCQALLMYDFQEAVPHDLSVRYEKDNESVEIGLDLESGKIIILIERS